MNKYAILGMNIVFLAVPLALIEIVFEKSNGWGSGFSKSSWYGKSFFPNSKIVKTLVSILSVELPLNYHVFVFAGLIPVFLLAEYFFLTSNALLLVACYYAILVFEDFFWFLFNWNFDSLNQLTKGPKGSIWWHKRWIRISPKRYLPMAYPVGLAFAALFYFVA